MKWFERTFTFGLPPAMLPFYLERLYGTYFRIKALSNGLDEQLLSEKFNDKWSVKQHIGHLAEVDEVANKRIDEMLARQSEMSPAVFEPKDYSTWPIGDVLELFRRTRLANIEKYRGLGDDELTRTSLHPRLKVLMSPVDLAWFDAEHDDHHLVAIRQIVERK